ncbi:hypothetical protein [Caballeronia humi]|nr:hypothetical protein [Caballeronia humi]
MAYSKHQKKQREQGVRMIGRALSLSISFAATVSALAGCSSAPPLFSSDGRPTTLIQCPAYGGWTLCQQNARATCQGASYDVLEQSTDNGQNGLLIACKTQ